MIFSMKTDVNTLTISTTCKLLNFSGQSTVLRQVLIFYVSDLRYTHTFRLYGGEDGTLRLSFPSTIW